MKKLKQIGAIISLAIIALSYIVTIISVFMKNENWITYLYGSIFVTIVFPIIIYAMGLIEKYLLSKKDKEKRDLS